MFGGGGGEGLDESMNPAWHATHRNVKGGPAANSCAIPVRWIVNKGWVGGEAARFIKEHSRPRGGREGPTPDVQK